MTPANRTRLLTALALVFAMTFPTVAAWAYVVGLATGGSSANPWQQAAYVAGKVVQFGFPVAFLISLGRLAPPRRRRQRGYAELAPVSGPPEGVGGWDVELDAGRLDPRRIRLSRPHFSGLMPGPIFGLTVAGVILAAYFGGLRSSSLLAETPAHLRHKLQEVNMATPAGYAALAAFLVAAHSLLEEYYWRWFVFGGLRQFMALAPALVLSSLAFMAHHVVVLAAFLPGQFWPVVVALALAVAVGGGVWAWLYDRSGSLWSPWVSHLIVDAAIFVVGWDLLWPF